MSAREMITEHLDLWTGAVTKKSSSGRGNKGKVELTGVKKLRELILELAVRGLLSDQLSTDEPANKLIEKIIPEVEQLIKDGRFKVPKEPGSNSEVEGPFKIPRTWIWCSLDRIAVIARGGSPRPIKAYTTTEPNGLNWIKIGDAKKGSRLITEAAEKIIPEGLRKTRMVYPGDLILSNSMSFGQPYILDIEGCIHDGWLLLRTPEGLVDKVFLYYLLLSPYAMNAFTDSAAGAVVQNLNADKVRLLQVPLPPLEEQHRIVQKVDELMALCDRLEQQTSDQLEAHETLVDTLLGTLTQSENATELADNWARLAAHFDTLFTTEQSIDKLKQTILQLAVMGRLVEQDAGDEPACELLNRIAQEKIRLVAARKLKKQKPLTEIGDEDKPFELPSGWHWARFGDVCAIKGELVRPESFPDLRQVAPDCIEKGTGRITENRTVKESGVKGPNSRFYAGQIVYSKIRPSLSKAALVDFDGLCSADMYPIDAFIDSRFLLMEILSEIFLQQVRVAENRIKMPKLNQESLTGFVLPIPPLTEQHRIVQKVDELMALCDQLKERINQASETRCQLAEAVVENALN
ncbi:restriction endonuclease subunit S [Marinobacter nauticus]|uniref:restriction endonuclease subunit S n=1 Tax=Marinobacter nauticus TaxID=2743 RepID=UPI00242A6363|nr:restriction endonuclease subunit S [Marinobacter nauticus]